MYEFYESEAKRVLRGVTGDHSLTVHFERSREEGHGDLSTSVALGLAKKMKVRPQEIAQKLADGMAKVKGIERVEVAGAGYVNLWLNAETLIEELRQTQQACAVRKPKKDDAPVIIDFFGPNIAKPLGMHHILTTIIGQSLINLYRHMGFTVIGWSYPGDWGTQFGKLAVAYRRWGEKKPLSKYSVDELLALYVRFHAEAEQNESMEEEARKLFALLEEGDKELRAFREEVVRITKHALDALCERLHVHVDVETGESFYEDRMVPILEEGIKKGIFTKSEGGALIVEFPSELSLPPYLLRKSDGATLYATRDLAMVRYRLDAYHPKAIYYVVGVAQSLHLQQLFATCRLLGWNLPEIEHTLFGHMRFKDASMSTRKGTALRLEDVLDESVKRADILIAEHDKDIQTDNRKALAEMMGVGAVVYGVLSQSRIHDIIFDWEKALSLEGNSALYIQYTYARARSVLRKSEVSRFGFPKDVRALSVHERSLIGVLLQFGPALCDACKNRMPHTLANYLYDLCQTFNSFYNAEPILKAEGSTRELRLSLTDLTASVLKTGAEILSFRVPERM
ncbi:MAG: arginine--tRNA ligase [Candidatus Peregrinibacteria bacterium]